MSTSTERLVVDLLDPDLYQSNPHDVWAWMRANEPVYRDEKNGLWGLTRHADVMDVERRSSVFSSKGVYRANISMDEKNMIAQDDPRHRQQRMLVQPQLTRSAVAERTQEIETLVAELISEAVDKGEFEVVEMLAAQLPARLTSRLLGFPEEMWPQLKLSLIHI
jgi:cytochrome P450 family 142 subfamily A polypeptide 1